MRYNPIFADVIGLECLHGVTKSEIPDLYREAVAAGWVLDSTGAWLLKRFSDGYFGSRSAFTDITGYEAAVNGRGIPDLDFRSEGQKRARDLVRRGFAFAWTTLFALRATGQRPMITAIISVSAIEMDNEVQYTGNVTFVSVHKDEPSYLSGIDQIRDAAALMIDLSECDVPLPEAANE